MDEWNRLRTVPSFGRLLCASGLVDDDLPLTPREEALPTTRQGFDAGPAPPLRPLHHARRCNVQRRSHLPDGLTPVKPLHCTLTQVIEIGPGIAIASIAALNDLNRIAATNGIPLRFNVVSFCSGWFRQGFARMPGG